MCRLPGRLHRNTRQNAWNHVIEERSSIVTGRQGLRIEESTDPHDENRCRRRRPGQALFTARLLEEKHKGFCQITIFEASHRTGGKVVTRQFDSAPVCYEAGVAELYNYAEVGPDPLLQLVEKLGLKTVPMDGQTVVLNGRILNNPEDIQRLCGPATLESHSRVSYAAAVSFAAFGVVRRRLSLRQLASVGGPVVRRNPG